MGTRVWPSHPGRARKCEAGVARQHLWSLARVLTTWESHWQWIPTRTPSGPRQEETAWLALVRLMARDPRLYPRTKLHATPPPALGNNGLSGKRTETFSRLGGKYKRILKPGLGVWGIAVEGSELVCLWVPSNKLMQFLSIINESNQEFQGLEKY